MAVTNGLCTAAQLKSYFALNSMPPPVGGDEDANIDRAINSASRAIGRWCGRQFYDAGSASARRFVGRDAYCLVVDDFHTTTGLVIKTDENDDGTFEVTWTSSDYELEPIDGVQDGMPGWPYQKIHAVGSYTFPIPTGLGARRYTVEVTARWGWSSVPDDVVQAALQVSAELYRRGSAPFGIAQTVEFGPIRLASDTVRAVSSLLHDFRRAENVMGVA